MFNFKNSNSGKIRVKLLATLLVLTLTFANFALVGSYIGEAIAAGINLNNQDDSTDNENVKFELYFVENNSNIILKDMNVNDLVLNAKISVKNAGVLENAKLELTDTNFELSQDTSLDIGTIQAGGDKVLTLPIQMKKDVNTFNLGLLDMMSKITLTGNYKNGTETININTPKYVQVNWTSEAIKAIPDGEQKPIELTQELITNNIYNIGDGNKRVIQYKITSGITNNQYPIKSTTIELQAPKYDGATKQILKAEQIVEGVNAIAPEKVVVSAYSLNATNPNEILNFKAYETITEENVGYEYNNQDGKVKINVINKPNTNNEIKWNSEGKDEFIVTYVYPVDVQVSEIEFIANSKINLHDIENRELPKDITNTQIITEDFGNTIKLESGITPEIFKGNMYLGEDTNYQTISKMHFSYSEVADNIIFAEATDLIAEGVATDFKETKINKADAIKVLGTETGKISVFNAQDLTTPLQEINLSQEIEEDYYTISYGENVSQILIMFSDMQSEGTIEVINEKTIKVTDIEAVSELTEIKANAGLQVANITEINGKTINTPIETINVEKTAQLVEPVSDAEFAATNIISGTTNFGVLQENNVNFTVTLKTDNIKYDLYENPEVTITLPDVVESIEDVNAVMMNSSSTLTVVSADPENNTIKVKLSGKQETYTSASEQVSINAKITTNKLIPTLTRDIVMTLTNGKETIYPNNAESVVCKQTVTFEAEPGVLLATSVSNYNSENTTITSFREEIATGTITENAEARTATVKGTIINNTETDLENIVIFGKLQDERIETPIAELDKVEKGSVSVFDYNIEIPENLETNKEIIVNYEVDCNNQTYPSPVVKLQTPKEVKLNLELTADVQEGQTVYEGQKVTYNVKVTNTGEVDAENVSLNILSEGLTISRGQSENINIEAGKNIEKQIEAIVNKDVTTASLTVEAKNIHLKETKKTITNTVEKTGIELEIDKTISTYSQYTDVAQIGSSIDYQLEITNVSNEDINNIRITDHLPEGLRYEKLDIWKVINEEITSLKLAQIENDYDEQTKELSFVINNLKPGEQAIILISTSVEKVADSLIVNPVYVQISEKYPNVTFSVVDEVEALGEPEITTTIKSNKNGNLNIGDIIEYTVKVRNEGETTEYITIEDKLPKELKAQNAYYYYTEEEQKEASINLNSVKLYDEELKQNEEITIKIIAQVKEIQETTTIENYATIKGIYTDLVTDKIENTIIGTGQTPEDTPSETPGDNPGQTPGDNPGQTPEDTLTETPGEDSEKTYSITGIAWQDDNKNGARENEEKVLEGIGLKIIDANTNKYLLDEQGKEIKQTTNKKGEYQFDNLKPGKYILVFDYNKTTYSLTTYQKTEVENTINSDARLVTENNVNITKTDILEITQNNISNIDIGLIVNPIFDLKLDKYITKVTVQNSEGTKVYEYDKTQLAKVEIPAKVLEGSIVIIEYQIDVKNEGAVKAHVNNIVDYVSPQFEFKSELNTTWYQGKDKNLYCTEFANKDLKPGETVSTKLVLTKTMTSDNTGLVNNAAEIYETFNEYAYQDIDSTPANKAEEDDLSQADIIISPKTGGPLLYISIVIISMIVLSAGIYLINKKVIKNHII